MFDQKWVPPVMWRQAEAINTLAACLREQILSLQRVCSIHQWEKVIEYDADYSPNADGHSKGARVVRGHRCNLCTTFKPLGGQPYDDYRMCGGRMNPDSQTVIDGTKVNNHKCVSCGHVYQTT
jgi:hypothetical protein